MLAFITLGTAGLPAATMATSPSSGLGPIPAHAYHLSPSGSDSNPGTAAAPWRTLVKAVATVGPGDTVVLGAGTYGSRGSVNWMSAAGTAGQPITYRGHPDGPMPRILGHVRINASHQRFNYLLFDGPTGPVKPPTAENRRGEEVQVAIYGSATEGVEISDSEVRNSDWHAGIFLSEAENARIIGNYIHGNGDEADPGQENQSHGVYWSSGSGVVANNVIERNLARGIQLYKRPRAVTIANNTVVRNGKAGIQFGRETSHSIAVNNIVAYNGMHGIRSHSLTAPGNVVERNLVWKNGGNDLSPADGLSLRGNIRAHPGFGPESRSYRPSPSSPAIDRAVGRHAPADDFDGSPRPHGAAPDLGAFEDRSSRSDLRLGRSHLRLGKLKRHPRRGTARLAVRVSGPGRIVLQGKRLRRIRNRADGAGWVKLRMRPKRGVAKRLRARGRARVRFRVAYMPAGDRGRNVISKRRQLVRR